MSSRAEANKLRKQIQASQEKRLESAEKLCLQLAENNAELEKRLQRMRYILSEKYLLELHSEIKLTSTDKITK